MSRRELVISYASNSRIRPRLRDYTTTCLIPLVLSLVSSTCTGTGISTFFGAFLWNVLVLPESLWLFFGAFFGLALGKLNKTLSMCTSLYVAGAFIYLALTLLMPGVNKAKGRCTKIVMMIGVFIGMLVMFFITKLEWSVSARYYISFCFIHPWFYISYFHVFNLWNFAYFQLLNFLV